MKKFWWAVAILIVLFGATLYNSYRICTLTDTLSGQLVQAEKLAKGGDWSQAEAITLRAQETWDSQTGYLYMVLRHADADNVEIGFDEVLEFLRSQELGEYASANSALAGQIRLLADLETLSLKNIL